MKSKLFFCITLSCFLVSCTQHHHRSFSTAEEWKSLKDEEKPRGYWLAGNFIAEQKPGALNDFFGQRDNIVNMILVVGAIDANR